MNVLEGVLLRNKAKISAVLVLFQKPPRRKAKAMRNMNPYSIHKATGTL